MRERIKQIIEETLPLVDPESPYLYGDLDSLGVTTILMLLSEEYHITLDATDATPRNLRSLDALVEMVKGKLQ